MPTDEAEGPSGGAGRRGAGHHGVADQTTAAEELAFLVGGLLIELGSKIQEAGIDGVRILTEEEAQQTQLRWFREGWTEHARATEHARVADAEPRGASGSGTGTGTGTGTGFRDGQAAGHDDTGTDACTGAGTPADADADAEVGPSPASSARLLHFPADPRGTHPLPIVGTDEARGARDLMAHRPRRRREEAPKRPRPGPGPDDQD
ncbi:hypothetical protein AB0H82_13380 [Streptomyces sp. NPDC050732]|uniref:hypothetical protein n=1 Tax=Streptomyces sp. NPDC050732 TaxID=3154632 RepID=UPI00341F7297